MFSKIFKIAAIGCVLLTSAFFKMLQTRACRFYPSCSAYSIEAFECLGFFRGLFKTVHRVFRCHPFCEGGYDPLIKGNS